MPDSDWWEKVAPGKDQETCQKHGPSGMRKVDPPALACAHCEADRDLDYAAPVLDPLDHKIRALFIALDRWRVDPEVIESQDGIENAIKELILEARRK